MVKAVTGRSTFALSSGEAEPVPFIARPAPQPASKDAEWAVRQFEELERTCRALQRQVEELRKDVAALQAEVSSLAADVVSLRGDVDALEAAVGDGTWDG